VKATFDKLKALGAEVVAEPYRPQDNGEDFWLATLADPEGNYFQLATPIES
jgi:predicted enzyme related to lactoylglutathione lyase